MSTGTARRRPELLRDADAGTSILEAQTPYDNAEEVAVGHLTSEQVGHHLDMCRRCGLQADVYLQIKAALSSDRPVPEDAVERLRRFGEQLAGQGLSGSP